ncbi:MAG: hypothetical protein ACRCXL_09405 [Dermatophilaceae bacterium]
MSHDDQTLTAREASALLESSHDEALTALDVPTRLLLSAWGAGLAGGHLAIWWSVREQQPYVGPAGWALGVLGVLLAAAMALTIVTTARAATGVSGDSAATGRAYGLSWGVGFAGYGGLMVGLDRADASPAVVALVSAVVPLLVVAVIYVAASALWESSARAAVATGALLAGTAATASWFEPQQLSLVIAVGAGIAFGVGAALARGPR